MIITNIGRSKKIVAGEGLTIYSVVNLIYKTTFIISSRDSVDNYVEMTVEEASERAYQDRLAEEERQRREQEEDELNEP